jgi:hypothetical protein
MKTVVKRLIEQSTSIEEHGWGASGEVFDREKFIKTIVNECIRRIHFNCEDFENGNVFGGEEGQALFESITSEYGKSKERGFNPVLLAKFFDKDLKQYFGIKE